MRSDHVSSSELRIMTIGLALAAIIGMILLSVAG
jgi:hypothetical protein